MNSKNNTKKLEMMNMDYKEVKMRKECGLDVPIFSEVAAQSIGYNTRHQPQPGKTKMKPVINRTVLPPPKPLHGQDTAVEPVPSTSTCRPSTRSMSKHPVNQSHQSEYIEMELSKNKSRKSGLSISKNRTHSTPKRMKGPSSPSLLSGNVRTPENKPAVPEEQFSPIELFPSSQSLDIVHWNWQNNEDQDSAASVKKCTRYSKLQDKNPPEKQGTLKRKSPSPEHHGPPAKKMAHSTNLQAFCVLEEALLAVHARVSQLDPVSEYPEWKSDEDEDSFCVLEYKATAVVKQRVKESDSREIPIIPAPPQLSTSSVTQNKKHGSENKTIAPVEQPVIENKIIASVAQPIAENKTIAPVKHHVAGNKAIAPVKQSVTVNKTIAPVKHHVAGNKTIACVTQPVIENKIIAPVIQPVAGNKTIPPAKQPVIENKIIASVKQPLAGNKTISPAKQSVAENKTIAPVKQPVAKNKPVCNEVKKTVPLPKTNVEKDVEAQMNELLDDSMVECLIACSIQAEEECRLSQQLENNIDQKPSSQSAKPDQKISTQSTYMNNVKRNESKNSVQRNATTLASALGSAPKLNVPTLTSKTSGSSSVSTFAFKANVASTAPKPSTSKFAPKTSDPKASSFNTSTSTSSFCKPSSSFSSGISSSFPMSQNSLSAIAKQKASSLKTVSSIAMLPPRRSPRTLSISKRISPQKCSLSPAYKLPLVLSQSTPETDFNPSWMASIKNVASPLHSSLSNKTINESMSQKLSQSSIKTSTTDSKNISRTLFTSPQNSKIQSKVSEKQCKNKSESPNIQSPQINKANKSFDPFEDSFDTAFEDIDLEKMEAEMISQMEKPKEVEKKNSLVNKNKNAVTSTVTSQSLKSSSSFQSSFLPSQDKNTLLVSTVSSSQANSQLRQQNTKPSLQSSRHSSIPSAQNLSTTTAQLKSNSFPVSNSSNKPNNFVGQNKTSTLGKSSSSTNLNSGNQSNCSSVHKVVENQGKISTIGTTSSSSSTLAKLTSGVITTNPLVLSNNTLSNAFQNKTATRNNYQKPNLNNNTAANKPLSSTNVPSNKAVTSTGVTKNIQVPCNITQNKTENSIVNNKPLTSNNNNNNNNVAASSVVQNKPSTFVNNNKINTAQNISASTAQGNRLPVQSSVPQAQVSNPTTSSNCKPQWKPQTNGNFIQQKPAVKNTNLQQSCSKPSLPLSNPVETTSRNNYVLPQTNNVNNKPTGAYPQQKLNTEVNLQQTVNKQFQPQSNVNKAQTNGNAAIIHQNNGNMVLRSTPALIQSTSNNPLPYSHKPIQILPRNNTPLQQVSNTVKAKSNVPSSAVDAATKNNTISHVVPNSVPPKQASNPIVPKLAPVLGGSTLTRHKSADFAPNSNKPLIPNAVNQVRNNASPLIRHKSVGDFSSVQGSQAQRYSAMEIERKRQEAKQRLLQRRMQQ